MCLKWHILRSYRFVVEVTFKGVLRRNIEHFLKRPYRKNLEFLKWNNFSISNRLHFWFLQKYEPPPLNFIFSWKICDANNDNVLRIIGSLLLNVWSFFRFSLNFETVKELLKIRCHIYIFKKKEFWRRMNEENTCENDVFGSTILHHRKKLNIITPQLLMYYIQYQNGKSPLVHIQKQPLEVFCEKVFLQISQNSQETNCARLSFFNKIAGLRQLFLQSNPGRLLLKCRYCKNKTESIALLIFVLWRFFNVRWMSGGGVGQKSYLGPTEIASFSRRNFSRSN